MRPPARPPHPAPTPRLRSAKASARASANAACFKTSGSVTQHDGRNLSGAVARIVGLSSERGRQRAAPIYTRAKHHMLFCSPKEHGSDPTYPPLRIGATFSGSIGAVPWVHRRASRRPSPRGSVRGRSALSILRVCHTSAGRQAIACAAGGRRHYTSQQLRDAKTRFSQFRFRPRTNPRHAEGV
jgi:hypothetical protein